MKTEDLTGILLVGAIASVGAIFAGPPAIGITGLVLCGGGVILTIASQVSSDQAARAKQLSQEVEPPAPAAAPTPLPPLVAGNAEAQAAAKIHWSTLDRAQFRSEARQFLKHRRNQSIYGDELRGRFRLALAQVRREALFTGESLPISRWLLRARAQMKRWGDLP